MGSCRGTASACRSPEDVRARGVIHPEHPGAHHAPRPRTTTTCRASSRQLTFSGPEFCQPTQITIGMRLLRLLCRRI
jgi:hypothetical protein